MNEKPDKTAYNLKVICGVLCIFHVLLCLFVTIAFLSLASLFGVAFIMFYVADICVREQGGVKNGNKI